MKISCTLKTIYRTLLSFIKTGNATTISGHDYIETTNGLKCSICGYIPEQYERISVNAVKCLTCGVIIYCEQFQKVNHICKGK